MKKAIKEAIRMYGNELMYLGIEEENYCKNETIEAIKEYRKLRNKYKGMNYQYCLSGELESYFNGILIERGNLIEVFKEA